MILGMPLQKDLWKMSVELGGEPNLDSLAKMIVLYLQDTLKSKSSFREEDIFTTLEGPLSFTITVTCYGQKKIPEKNGVT